jgi:membrane peptidoglycan carboxypeptidase
VTWRLEAIVPKPIILARYLELIELGEGIYGLEAASRHYFGKPAADLGVAESAFLAALTPAPRTLSRRLREAGRVDDDMARRVDVVLRAMRGAGVIDSAELARAAARPLRLRGDALARR